jgi:hypothetical protein
VTHILERALSRLQGRLPYQPLPRCLLVRRPEVPKSAFDCQLPPHTRVRICGTWPQIRGTAGVAAAADLRPGGGTARFTRSHPTLGLLPLFGNQFFQG